LKGQLIGYGGTNQWKVWIPEKNEVVTSAHVIFDEEKGEQLMTEIPAEHATEPIIHDEIRVLPDPDQYPTPPTTIRSRTASPEPEKSPSVSEDKEDEESQQPEKPARKQKPPPPPPSRVSERSGKGQHAPRFGETVAKLAQSSNPDDEEEPTTYREATTHPTCAKQWEKAIMDEYHSIMRNNTWKLVPRPANRQVVTCKWVFKHKKDQFGRITRLKVRLVARGFSQVYGIDYLDTYAPVAKLASIRILFVIAASLDLEIHQMDIVTAFLANILHEEIYMEQPEGFVDDGHDVDMVCELEKSLYGLKQSARLWNQKLDGYLRKIGYTQTNADHCVYVNNDNGVIVAMWVDDLIIFGKDPVGVDLLKLQLRMKFELKDMGELQYFLGIQVLRDRKKKLLQILQCGYVNMILE